ncbi:MAG: hypothetical protein PXX83_07315 [Candidatus Nitrosotalea sp.]|nr:hypothetical protein [Candidatus Nitrosotalea sp.]
MIRLYIPCGFHYLDTCREQTKIPILVIMIACKMPRVKSPSGKVNPLKDVTYVNQF